MAMQAAAISKAGADLFDEVDRQLANLARAAARSGNATPRVRPAAIIHERPRPISRRVAPAFAASRLVRPRPLSRLLGKFHAWRRVAALAGVLVAALGLGWFGVTTLAQFLHTRTALTGRAAVEAAVTLILGAESSLAAESKNKRSSAAGPAQFLDETWLEMLRAYRPDLAKGRTRAEVLELRLKPGLARELTTHLAERNAALLARRGLPVTAGTIYLAHFAGGAGAAALLSAPADADAALVMAKADATGKTRREQIVKANPFLDKFTVADIRRWAERKMSGPELVLSDLLSAKARP